MTSFLEAMRKKQAELGGQRHPSAMLQAEGCLLVFSRWGRVELPACDLQERCSSQLSYTGFGRPTRVELVLFASQAKDLTT